VLLETLLQNRWQCLRHLQCARASPQADQILTKIRWPLFGLCSVAILTPLHSIACCLTAISIAHPPFSVCWHRAPPGPYALQPAAWSCAQGAKARTSPAKSPRIAALARALGANAVCAFLSIFPRAAATSYSFPTWRRSPASVCANSSDHPGRPASRSISRLSFARCLLPTIHPCIGALTV
jgi:hypothetical protein